MPDEALVAEQVFEELELPLQYGASVQHVELVVQDFPGQLVIEPHAPVVSLHVVPVGHTPE